MENKRIYIASSFSMVDKVDTLSKILELEGHTITVKWWDRKYEIKGEQIHTTELKKTNHELDPITFNNLEETALSFWNDYNGIVSADIFIFYADDNPRKYNGASVELGIALGQMTPCYLLGKLENSVLFSTLNHCESIGVLLWKLEHYCDMQYEPLCQYYKGKKEPCAYGKTHGVICPYLTKE